MSTLDLAGYCVPVMVLAVAGVLMPTMGLRSGRIRQWVAGCCFIAESLLLVFGGNS